MEKLATLSKSKNPEKSQTELRASFEKRFLGMKDVIKQATEEYQNALKDETFEDREGEEEGEGERRKEILQEKINALLDRAEQMKIKLDSKDKLPNFTESISAIYKQESITLDLEQKIEEFKDFYKKTKLDLPPDFEDQIKEIWENNIDEIQKSIEGNGFNEMLLVPGNIPLAELNTKMTDVYNETYQDSDFKSGGSFAKTQSQNVDKTRIVLAHKIKNLEDHPELKKTLNTKGQDVNMDQTLTLEDYLIFQRKFFEETGEHLDSGNTWTWLATKSGARLVSAHWAPSGGRVYVLANDLGSQDEHLGARPSRSFF